ncbi:MAG: hypothetical protein KGH49_01630, partial [Candidatus Micrarchaeota archaeon]|nr:hypothetical protein [Candidatus Micrarchaeota archaeon]
LRLMAREDFAGLFPLYRSKDTREKVMNELVTTAQYSPESFENALRGFSIPEVADAINRFEGVGNTSIISRFQSHSTGNFGKIHEFYGKPKDNDALKGMAGLLSAEMSEATEGYSEQVRTLINDQITHMAFDQKPKELIESVCSIMSSADIRSMINKCGQDPQDLVGWTISRNFVQLCAGMNDRDTIVRIAKVMDVHSAAMADAILFRMWAEWEGNESTARVANMLDKLERQEIAELLKSYGSEVGGNFTGTILEFALAGKKEHSGRLVRLLNIGGEDISIFASPEEADRIIGAGLDLLINDRHTLSAVAAYIRSGEMLPMPTAQNIADYEKIAAEHFQKEYNVKSRPTLEQINMLLSYRNLKRAARFIDSEREDIVEYSLDDFRHANVGATREELMQYCVIGVLGSRDKQKEAVALDALDKIVGRQKVERARGRFQTNHKDLKREIFGNGKMARGYENVYNMLKGTEDEAIIDVLAAAEHIDLDVSRARSVRAFESKRPLDYDSRVQIACVYLPRGDDIYKYAANREITLIAYEIGGVVLGSAICLNREGRFIVDSVEGHTELRSHGIFEVIYNDIIWRARKAGAGRVVFANVETSNLTPLQFMRYVKGKGLAQGEVGVRTKTSGYMEARKHTPAYIVELDGAGSTMPYAIVPLKRQ